MAKDKSSYKPAEVCRELDIQPYVLRYWETEFPALAQAEKPGSGQRSYSAEELDVLRRIKELLYEEGYTIAGAKKKLGGELSADGPQALARRPAPEKPAETAEATPEPSAAAPSEAGASEPQPAAKAKPAAPAKKKSSPRAAKARERQAKPAAAPAQADPNEQIIALREGLAGLLVEARELLERLPR